MNKHKTIIVIRDGWGYRNDSKDNAILEANTPNTDNLMNNYPNVLLDASGEAVGLPKGYQGNSEVGHMTIGSGRLIFQSLTRINKSISDGTFFEISELLQAINNCKKNNCALHLIGLLQVEGVHAHINHLFAILELCKKQGFENVFVHVITDGRDAPVHNSLIHVEALLDKFKELGFGSIATISGRYFTMDRDKRWDRTKLAYDCIVNADCEDKFSDPIAKIKECHATHETDEFIKPRAHDNYSGVQENDSIIFYNFRTDRPRQFTQAVVEKDFFGWERKPMNVFYMCMTQYYRPMNASVAFKVQSTADILGEVVSKAGLKQLRISETEKYAHVTFFFNAQIEEPFFEEDRILVNSPKVATYDLQPEMSVYEVTEKLVENIKSEAYDFIVVNLVNGDMVGHTGILEAIKKAVIAVDDCVGKIVSAGLKHDYSLLVFADHGNVEDQTPEWRTSHTTNPVPLILVSNDEKLMFCSLKKGKGLKDIAPTVLKLLGLEKPNNMTGESII
ncbi:MAG: 2,3-bisphosphoglycerate-independent phosphoglycerate mutase [Nanoarchaeota archaeon]|nr:2,3-bisphosphoglycerate-independent phosphoglycerate mutase [Nanoarchaeota archaeon]MBU1030120.1 2,3-bisphosphoglycerate-independent phosphoglycerate mutase [Nanoarchaeota archaeon]MBU1850003.1 2,3-bisphosphoglycerate-independent phosphoglycerate mutase [Nanoarchaeota archaeon]